MFRATVAAVFGLCAMLGAANAQPVLDVDAVPSLNAQARASYAIFLRMNLPRAAAVSSAGAVFGQFEHDPYRGPDLAGRAELVRSTLRPAVAGLLLIDRPAGFDGHFSGETADFAIKFGDCIFRFAIGQPASCGPAVQIFNR